MDDLEKKSNSIESIAKLDDDIVKIVSTITAMDNNFTVVDFLAGTYKNSDVVIESLLVAYKSKADESKKLKEGSTVFNEKEVEFLKELYNKKFDSEITTKSSSKSAKEFKVIEGLKISHLDLTRGHHAKIIADRLPKQVWTSINEVVTLSHKKPQSYLYIATGSLRIGENDIAIATDAISVNS